MEKAKIILTHAPSCAIECPFCDICGYGEFASPSGGCQIYGECEAFDDMYKCGDDLPSEFNFEKCPHCVSIDMLNKRV